MNYLSTSSVQVFPSTKRANKQVSARLVTEQAIVGIINKLIDRIGFVITKEEDIALNHTFEFNIFGYYFIINTLQEIVDLYNDDKNVMQIYGNIQVAKSGNYTELFGQDDDDTNIYNGISFTSEPITSSERTCYNLLLLKRDAPDSDWYVPDESRVRFDFDSIAQDLDMGEI